MGTSSGVKVNKFILAKTEYLLEKILESQAEILKNQAEILKKIGTSATVPIAEPPIMKEIAYKPLGVGGGIKK